MGKVKRIVDFGAFVEILPGTEGLLHISQIAEKRIAKVTDELKEGQEILVKVIEIDKMGRIRLSKKEAMREHTATES
jgi:polyribonucleotide nucleotidyltransferase